MLPATTDPTRPQSWAKGVGLPTPCSLLPVPGFAHYVWDAVGQVLICEEHRDRCNRKHKRRVVKGYWMSGTYHYRLWRGGFIVGISERRLKKLVECG